MSDASLVVSLMLTPVKNALKQKKTFLNIFTAHGRRQYCFQHRCSFFLCYDNNSWSAALSLMKFCVSTYLDNPRNPI